MRLFQILWGLAWIAIGLIAGTSWIVFCFGSVIGVILILLFAPALLFLPFGLSAYGLAILNQGLSGIKQTGHDNVGENGNNNK